MGSPTRHTGAAWLLVPMVFLALSACIPTADSPITTEEEATTTSASTETTTTSQTDRTTTSATTSSTSTTVVQLPVYEIFEFQDVGALAVRYVAHVLTEPGTSGDQLTQIAQLIADEVRLESPYQAWSVGFYDYPEYLGFGFVMGRVEFAPFGDWGLADQVELGDYSTFESKSFFREKDWAQRPTQDEVTIWRRWETVINELDPDLTREDVLALEMEAYEMVAEEFDLPVSDVEGAVQNAAFWPFS